MYEFFFIEQIWILYIQESYIHLHSLTFSINMLGERIERNIIIGDNDKIDLKII
jgi:hypothetical protein